MVGGREITDSMAREHAAHLAEIDRAPNPNCPVCTRAKELATTDRASSYDDE